MDAYSRKRELFILLPLILLLSVCHVSEGILKLANPQIIKHPMQDIVGIYLEEQRAPPLFYDTFYPIVYEIPAPTWKAADLRLNLPKNQSYINASELLYCNDTTNATDLWASSLCPITLKLNELLDRFAEEMKVFETFNASVSKLDSSLSSCHEIKPHFSNHIIDEIEIELYLVQVILDCPLSDVIHHKLILPQPKGERYAEILRMFLETHISPKFRIIGYSKYAISTNTLLALHTTELLDFLLDTFQWSSSLSTCNAQRIPRLLVPQETLKSTLQEIERKIENQNMMLSISIADLSNYYKLELADCVMTSQNNFIIRVLVPLIKKSSSYRMLNVKSIPFLNRDNASTRAMICQHRAVEGSIVTQGLNTSTVAPIAKMSCDESELCGIPPDGDRPVFSKCLYSALRNYTRGMIESCHMTCVPYDSSYLPYIKRIRSDQFVIVGKSSAEMAVICKREEKPIEVVGIPEWVGSLIITLPCTCHLTHRSEKYEINGPCDFVLEFRPIRPKGWTNDALLSHFRHHHSPNKDAPNVLSDITLMHQAAPPNTSSNGDDVTEKEEDEDLNDIYYMDSSSCCVAWPVYLAYVLLFIGMVMLTAGFYILRNVYVRIGLLEMSTALSSPSRVRGGMQYTRNAPVQFSARPAPSYSSGDPVY